MSSSAYNGAVVASGVLRIVVACAVGACSFEHGHLGGTADDAGPGGDSDAVNCDDLLPFQPSNFARCDMPAVGVGIVVGASSVAVLDTKAMSFQIDQVDVAFNSVVIAQPGGPELLVITADSVTIDGQLSVVGARPVAIVAVGAFTVTGSLSAGASTTTSGPGADVSACGTDPDGATQLATDGLIAGSGGGGGGFAKAGGIGARIPTGPSDVPGGAANGTTSLIPLRGGCHGGDGGFGNAVGGGGGGGLQLVAGVRLQIGGSVSAPGGGGTGTSVMGGGGGGGGSGGAILLEAPDLSIGGFVSAQGGAGGEGSRRTDGFTGAGQDGHTSDATAAVCVPVSASGGKGGDGGAGATLPGNGTPGVSDTLNAAGGGGGGGSVGRIHLGVDASPSITGLVSPAAT